MKFDWYQASIPGVSPSLVMETLSKADYYGDWQETRPQKGYAVGAQFVVGDESLYQINYGGTNEEYGANVQGTGGSAPKLAGIIRENFPAHRIARLDTCEDFFHKDMYRYLREKALAIAKEQKVYVEEIVKPAEHSDDGCTLYLGAKSSAVRMRIYEKGKQLGMDAEWVRAELQIRPQKDMKTLLAMMSPAECWGTAKWSQKFASELSERKVDRIKANVRNVSNDERAYRYFIAQYGNVLKRMVAVHGSWETVGAQIGMDIEAAGDKIAAAVLGEFQD